MVPAAVNLMVVPRVFEQPVGLNMADFVDRREE
jgi:hypothetical protein